MRTRPPVPLCLGVLLSALLGAAGCKTTLEHHHSGFLGDAYADLRTDSATGNQEYRSPNADLSRYDRVMIDPVEIWMDPETRYRSVSWSDIRRCARAFEQALREALAGRYPIVDTPGPDVLRVRAALTGVQPRPTGYSTRENLGYGDPDTVDQVREQGTGLRIEAVTVEAEFLDSATGERLFAAVERGKARDEGDRTSWDAVSRIFAGWAQRLRAALDAAHGG